MKVSLNWLKDFVDIDVDLNTLVEKLVSCGFEVEEIEKESKDVQNVIVAQIVDIKKHPNADKLQICQLKISENNDELLQIVTAANNIFIGAKVPLALDGAKLPNNINIKTGKLRGIDSFGMMCGGEEILVTEDDYKGASVNGILILEEKEKLGTDINEILNRNDIIMDIAVTSNRPDCNSILGIAREVAAVLGKRIKLPDLSYNTKKTKKILEIKREDKELCSRYIGCIVENIKNIETPKIIKKRLNLLGHRSISPIVDITNYVRIEMGQPMHAFDLTQLSENKIIIRKANKNEELLLLDEQNIKLNESNLVIADANKPLALAGIMGGILSGINNDTKDIVFESAAFKKENIRKTSRDLNVRSDSSFRFERGIDNLSQEEGMKRALHLVDKYNLGNVTDCYVDNFDGYKEQETLKIPISEINKVLGIKVDINKASKILNSLEIKNKIDIDSLLINPPLFRDDIKNKNDIAEEVIRFLGYDNIKPTLLNNAKLTLGGRTDSQKRVLKIKNRMVENGYHEILTYSFTSPKMIDILNLKDEHYTNCVKLGNPLGYDLSIMRTTLAYSILNTIEYNSKRDNSNIRLFEIAKVYINENKNEFNQPDERYNLVFASTDNNDDFYILKDLTYKLINIYSKNIEIKPSNMTFLHPGKSIDIFINNEFIGYLGEVHPKVQKELEIPKTNICELDIDKLESLYKNTYKFKPISKFPVVERDIALTFNENINAKQIIDIIKKAGGNILIDSQIFDIFRSEKIGNDNKSVAIKLKFNSLEKTLSDEDIEKKTQKIIKSLEIQLNAKLR